MGPQRREDVDLAMTPVVDHENEDLSLLKVYGDHIPDSHLSKRTVSSAHSES